MNLFFVLKVVEGHLIKIEFLEQKKSRRFLMPWDFFYSTSLLFLRNKRGTVTTITRTTPIITMPSVDPTSEISFAGGVGVATRKEDETVLKFCADAVR